MSYANLEIALRKRDERSYFVHFSFHNAGDAAEQNPDQDPVIAFAPGDIAGTDAGVYGDKLTKAFFTADVAALFNSYRDQAAAATLRVRLTIESSAPELHSLRWETLRDPRTPADFLFVGEQVLLSRYLTSGQDWRPVRLSPRDDLTALVVIANPLKLADPKTKLEPVKVEDELKLVRDALQPADPVPGSAKIAITAMAPGGGIAFTDLIAELQKGYDILYLVCHGRMLGDDPYLYLEDTEQPLPADQLVQSIRRMDRRPRLVVMASCQSAGEGGVGLAALGPQLAKAGVPAVVGMQGSVFMKTSGEFMKRFFGALVADGQIDRAMAVARAAVNAQGQPDFWMPALFLRLIDGCLWYSPGFESTGKSEFEQWNPICSFVRNGRCVPIIGPDVAEHISGSTKELAQDLMAQEEIVPLDPHDQYDMAKLTQYLATKGGWEYARDAASKVYLARLEKSAGRIVGPEVQTLSTHDLIEALVAKVTADESGPAFDPKKRDPLRIAAGLNARVFINASNDDLFETFLRQSGKAPAPMVAHWRDSRGGPRKTQVEEDEDIAFAEPSPEKPAVYYVFGKRKRGEPDPKTGAEVPHTWVLTEDDFFDYLIKSAQYQPVMPGEVSEAIVTGSLLFLGFPLEDWKFRVLFRMIQAKGGAALMQANNDMRHVGVQVDPGETTMANARLAKRYLEKYFGNAKIDIYWGSAADFLRDLKVQLDKKPARAAGRSE